MGESKVRVVKTVWFRQTILKRLGERKCWKMQVLTLFLSLSLFFSLSFIVCVRVCVCLSAASTIASPHTHKLCVSQCKTQSHRLRHWYSAFLSFSHRLSLATCFFFFVSSFLFNLFKSIFFLFFQTIQLFHLGVWVSLFILNFLLTSFVVDSLIDLVVYSVINIFLSSCSLMTFC